MASNWTEGSGDCAMYGDTFAGDDVDDTLGNTCVGGMECSTLSDSIIGGGLIGLCVESEKFDSSNKVANKPIRFEGFEDSQKRDLMVNKQTKTSTNTLFREPSKLASDWLVFSQSSCVHRTNTCL